MGTGKEVYRFDCASALHDALVEFGFTKKKAAEISCSDFMGHNVDIPFKFGRLVINKGSIDRFMRKGK